MARRKTTELPVYSNHKASGQAVVRLQGRDVYLGPHGTTASKAEYRRVITEWLAGGQQAVDPEIPVTVAEVAMGTTATLGTQEATAISQYVVRIVEFLREVSDASQQSP